MTSTNTGELYDLFNLSEEEKIFDEFNCFFVETFPIIGKLYLTENGSHALLLDPNAMSYGAACALIDYNLLPDAKLNSLNGDEYGRQFLHTHAQFITDYLFSKCREYDL